MSKLRVAIAGCSGRTGQAVVRVAAAEPDCQVVAAVTRAGDPRVGQDAGTVLGIEPLDVSIDTEIAVACDVLIEFTLPAGCVAWARWCAEHGVPLVSGTTGLDKHQRGVLHEAAQRVPVVWAANMSIGVNLMLALVTEAAARLGEEWDVEICETHHRHKVDAPSGTSRALLDAVCAARGQQPEKKAVHGRVGQPGPRLRGEVGVHALRMGAIVGEHEVHFTSDAESLALRHRAFSRDTFAAGALRAAHWLQGLPPGLYGMHDVLRA